MVKDDTPMVNIVMQIETEKCYIFFKFQRIRKSSFDNLEIKETL